MRILFCNFEYPPLGGGGGVVNSLIARELAKRHTVTVLTSQAFGLPSESIEENVRIIRVPVFFRKQQAAANLASMLTFIPMGIRAGKALLRSSKYDVINTHFVLPSGPVGDAIARFGGIPNVLSLHGGDLYDPSKSTSPHRHRILKLWIRRLLRRADVVVGQSTDTLGNMHTYYTPEINGVRIPLGIQRPCVQDASRREYGFSDDQILWVTIARLVARKAISQLIQIVARLGDDRIRLLIVGTGPQEEELRAEARRRKVENQVIFLGYVEEEEKFRILGMSDLYVSTSQHEGFGLVFLEAMACGLPVVCYGHGGQTDFLVDGQNGFLLPLNDIEGFMNRCAVLMEDRELRRKMGDRNRHKVEELYIDKCALNYENVFEHAIERNGKVKHSWLRKSHTAHMNLSIGHVLHKLSQSRFMNQSSSADGYST